jgi:hypothetical protein
LIRRLPVNVNSWKYQAHREDNQRLLTWIFVLSRRKCGEINVWYGLLTSDSIHHIRFCVKTQKVWELPV